MTTGRQSELFTPHPDPASGSYEPLRLAVLGTGRSGNTWMRTLLGHIYHLDESRVPKPADFDWGDVPRRCVLHAHRYPEGDLPDTLRRNGWRVVSMARHPLDVLVSRVRYAQSQRWSMELAGIAPSSEAFLRFATSRPARRALANSRKWWQIENTLRMRYEELVADTANQLERLVEEIGVPPITSLETAIERTTQARLRAGENHRHYWRGQPGLWRLLVPERQAGIIAEACRENLEFWNYTLDPDPELSDAQAGKNWRDLNGPWTKTRARRRYARAVSLIRAPLPLVSKLHRLSLYYLRRLRLALRSTAARARGPAVLPARHKERQPIPRPRPLVSDYEPQLQPLLVNGLGRSGSTWMMRLLLQDERIVAYAKHPHEMLAARRWMNLLQTYLEGDRWLGQHPMAPRMPAAIKDLVAETYPRDYARFCQQSIDRFYLTLAQTQGQTGPVYFAEKAGPVADEVELMREIYPDSKEVLLVRDFRDTFCSIRAFNIKRMRREFAWQEGMSDKGYMTSMASLVGSLVQSWRSRRGTSLLVRYEDLVRDPVASLARVFEYANLPVEPAQLAAMVEQAAAKDVPRHRTTESGTESIERWRRDLSPELQALASEMFGEALDEFGYAKD